MLFVSNPRRSFSANKIANDQLSPTKYLWNAHWRCYRLLKVLLSHERVSGFFWHFWPDSIRALPKIVDIKLSMFRSGSFYSNRFYFGPKSKSLFFIICLKLTPKETFTKQLHKRFQKQIACKKKRMNGKKYCEKRIKFGKLHATIKSSWECFITLVQIFTSIMHAILKPYLYLSSVIMESSWQL